MTPEVIVPSSLQISGRGARGSGQGELGSTCSSLNPHSPTASAPGAEPTFLEATPRSLLIHYKPGNMQEGPCIRRGGVNGPSLAHQSQACRLLPSEGRVGSVGCWSTPPLSSVQLLSPVLLFLTLWTGARQASLSITHSSSLWSFLFVFCFFVYFLLLFDNNKLYKKGQRRQGGPGSPPLCFPKHPPPLGPRRDHSLPTLWWGGD